VKESVDNLRNRGRGFPEVSVQEQLPTTSNEDRLTVEERPIQGRDEEDVRINSRVPSESKVRQCKCNLAQKCPAPTRASGKDGEVTSKDQPIEDRCAKQVGRHEPLPPRQPAPQRPFAKGSSWPDPGTYEGRLYGSSRAALTYASSATLESYCGCAAEHQTRSPLFATRSVEVPVMHAWRPVSHSHPYQTAIAPATGLIEPPEPADTILAPAPQPRCGAAGVCRAPRSRLGRQST